MADGHGDQSSDRRVRLESFECALTKEGTQALVTVICECGGRMFVQMVLLDEEKEILTTGNKCTDCGNSWSFLMKASR